MHISALVQVLRAQRGVHARMMCDQQCSRNLRGVTSRGRVLLGEEQPPWLPSGLAGLPPAACLRGPVPAAWPWSRRPPPTALSLLCCRCRQSKDAAPARVMVFAASEEQARDLSGPLRTVLWGDHKISGK